MTHKGRAATLGRKSSHHTHSKPEAPGQCDVRCLPPLPPIGPGRAACCPQATPLPGQEPTVGGTLSHETGAVF